MPGFFFIRQTILTACLLAFPSILFPQKSFEKNPYVKFKVDKTDSIFHLSYTFKDNFANLQTFELTIPRQQTERSINKFGIPKWLFEPYVDSEYNKYMREQEMKKGLFILEDNMIEVDKSAVIDYYAENFCSPIAQMIVNSLGDYGRDTRRDRIEMAMRFVQDIPYGIPDYEDEERHFGGVSPPPKLLIDMYGDCDSKALLFVGILIYLIPADDIVFLNQPKHVLSAVKAESEEGLTYLKYNGETFLIAETAGPGPRKLGQEGIYYNSRFTIEPLKIDPPEIIPFVDNQNPVRGINQLPIAGKESVLIRNQSEKYFRFQISVDNKQWKEFSLKPNQYGEYKFRKEHHVLLRFRDGKSSYIVYEMKTGTVYEINWNIKRKKWEVTL
ncbi:MAG: hypothetical protein JW731_12260 [Bacteroidales bacterium]|nr:hypothetical protein [Bacteroidales bacterium]